MRMLVLGAGLQGSACAYDLLQRPEVERVTLADSNERRAREAAARIRDTAADRAALLRVRHDRRTRYVAIERK